MNVLVLLDLHTTLNPKSDTSLLIANEMIRRGHRVAIAQLTDLSSDRTLPACRVQWLQATAWPLALTPPEKVALSEFASILIRKDPPYDTTYHLAMILLEQARSHSFLFNDPRGLRETNEKLYTFRFPDLIPETLVTKNIQDLHRFLQDQGGEMIIKPLDSFGGIGVFYLNKKDPNLNALLEMATHNHQWVLAQEYLPQVHQGDKRILLLNGKPLGTLLRIPTGQDIRSNLRAGGKAYKTEITEQDLAICERLAPQLIADGLYFVGLDIIGGYLTEVNVTSPTGVAAINSLEKICLEAKIVDFIEESSRKFLK